LLLDGPDSFFIPGPGRRERPSIEDFRQSDANKVGRGRDCGTYGNGTRHRCDLSSIYGRIAVLRSRSNASELS